MSEVVVGGQCVIWHCPNEPGDGRVACDSHYDGLVLPPPPCEHGVVGRCKRCWESESPEIKNARNREAYARHRLDPAWVERHREHKRNYMRERNRLRREAQLATTDGGAPA